MGFEGQDGRVAPTIRSVMTVALEFGPVDHRDGTASVPLEGSLTDKDWTSSLRRFLEPYLLNDRVGFIEIDLAKVDHIDLEGVAALLRLSADAIARGKALGVVGARGSVWAKLQQTSALSHLDKSA